ncbi:MAG: mannose-1-phosphate guanylyltransferase/mannose-6-phosphate isomerase [Desulfobulbaceae bacterium]|nr:mannose-1-phosphate guanylyltransferase/mannose-6-phosphate isomerase [Desulfobulbaceae bacterium]
MIPVILAGGSGTRLWPLSRGLYPKQFLPLVEPCTMLQATVARVMEIPGVASPVVICHDEHRFLVREQLAEIEVLPGAIILEPCGRNTAPAAAVAALQGLAGGDDDPILLLLPADHLIRDEAAFRAAVRAGEPLAAAGGLVTFGIVPDRPETGYGYIKEGESVAGGGYRVERFVEKPGAELAREYVDSGNYLWNSGIFMFKASRLLAEMAEHASLILAACRDAFAHRQSDLDFTRLGEAAFRECPSDSLDYAVMEKTAAAIVVPLECGWSDLGSWEALLAVSDRDQCGNAIRGDVLVRDVRDSYLRSESRLVAAIGVSDLIVVETADALLVADSSRSQEVKEMVEQLRRDKRGEAQSHRRVFRPWGFYEGLAADSRYQVKQIVVKPGGRLSMQMHHHRAEHWVVVRGTALVTVGEDARMVSENQSTYIPVGAKHRLENPGVIDLELIEIQTGSYLGEDDIVRFEDVYGRQDQKTTDDEG